MRRSLGAPALLATLILFVSLRAGAEQPADGAEVQQRPPDVYIPLDLDDCFVQLERLLKAEDVAAMRAGSEADMIMYHHGLGTWLRNNWGLWRGSRLSEWFNAHGIQHPDDMSGIILTSFWRHLHDKDVDLPGQISRYRAYWEEQRKYAEEERKRAAHAAQRINDMVIGMSLERVEAASVNLPPRESGGLRARHLARFGDGALLAVRRGSSDAFTTTGYFLDLKKRSLHAIQVRGIDETRSVVVAGEVAYFSGLTHGSPVLMAISGRQRSQLTLPRQDVPAVLGLEGSELLAAYEREIYRQTANGWQLVYRGQVDLPKSGPPPQKVGHRIYFRDEGIGEDDKRLWWLDLTDEPSLVALDHDVGVVGPLGPRWEHASSFCVTRTGVLWAALGAGSRTVIRRSEEGNYGLAVVNNSVRFDGELQGGDRDDGLDISAVALDRAGRLIAGGNSGLYAFDQKRIRQLVAFKTGTDGSSDADGDAGLGWDPSDILDLGGGRYLLSGMFGGIYLLEGQGGSGYRVTLVDDDRIGAPVSF